ncbi:MAG TPA: beta-propeller domain-containing protein [Egicoccus sp.]|nr:beta-propeller domain-containing protein [Egicoccus sp.]HSK24993.1 beta-propeller domain-containing protein [Egicoccus sp.]
MRRLAASLLLSALVLAGCTGTEGDAPRQGEGARTTGDDPFVLPDDLELAAASLSGFDACEDYLAHVKEAALEVVTPWGMGGGGWYRGMDGAEEAVEAEDSAGAADRDLAAAPTPGVDFSGTNVQEAGVDEPDRVKSDGDTMYVVNESGLTILDITGDDPVELGSLRLREAWDAQLLLDGDRLLITSSVYGVVPFAGERIAPDSLPYGGAGVATLTLVDVSDPADPQVTERLTVDGATVSSRLVDGVARVVVRTEQGINLPWVMPEGSGLRAERRALEANKDLIRASEAEDWIPYYIHETADGDTSEGTLLPCNRISHPQQFAGLGVLSVLTIDVAGGGLVPGDAAIGVLAGGDTVYASTERLYVATTRWMDWESMNDVARRDAAEDVVTELHAFDISDPATTGYLASGQVPGTLLSQWAMSEHEGRLRVASTVGDPWGWDGGGPSESVVTVLEPDGAELVEVGQVTGLGLTERIYAVRFIGDVGYVVTFRQTDPLYTLDLSDPTDPQVTGELKILGYSAYLHPVGEGLLLGVGQDADEDGRTKGTQLSLFDVSDPADPQRLDQVTLADGMSEVEYDHHAFLHWPATGLTVVPFQQWHYDEATQQESSDSGALAFTVNREDGIVEEGTLRHIPFLRRDLAELEGDDPFDLDGDGEVAETVPTERMWEWTWRGAISRSMVRGDRLLTLSQAGVATHDLDTLDDVGWYRFGS